MRIPAFEPATLAMACTIWRFYCRQGIRCGKSWWFAIDPDSKKTAFFFGLSVCFWNGKPEINQAAEYVALMSLKVCVDDFFLLVRERHDFSMPN